MKYTDEDLLDEIRRLNEELGHPPSLQEFRNHGTYSATTYYNRFGSWSEAVERAGFESSEPERRIATSDLLDELQRLADEHGSPPSVKLMNEHGKYSASAYKRRFGSWNEALEAAGFDPQAFDSKIPESALVAELRELAANSDSPPTFEEMEKDGDYGARTYIRRFGSWNEALAYAGLEVNTEQEISSEQLQNELKRVAEKLGKQPSAREMDEYGKYAVATYQRRFGSWSEALESVFDESLTHD